MSLPRVIFYWWIFNRRPCPFMSIFCRMELSPDRWLIIACRTVYELPSVLKIRCSVLLICYLNFVSNQMADIQPQDIFRLKSPLQLIGRLTVPGDKPISHRSMIL